MERVQTWNIIIKWERILHSQEIFVLFFYFCSDEYIAILKSLKDLSDDKIKSLAESYDSVFMCQVSTHIYSKSVKGV